MQDVHTEFLEKAAADLQAFRELAQQSMSTHQSRGPLKRTRVTSSDAGVSPDMARERPRSKLARKKLVFSCKPIKVNIYKLLKKFNVILVPERLSTSLAASVERSTPMASYADLSRPPLAPIGKEEERRGGRG